MINKTIPENYVLAMSTTAGEFLDEEIDEWIQLIPEVRSNFIYVQDNSQEMYKHQIWMSQEMVDKLNDARNKKLIAELERNKMEVVTKEQIKEMISSGKLVKTPMGQYAGGRGEIMKYDFSPYLIKVENHYVPASYLFFADSGQENIQYVDDKHASFPKIRFDDIFKKYRVEFDGADFGGYDVAGFTWYFDSIVDIIKEMMV